MKKIALKSILNGTLIALLLCVAINSAYSQNEFSELYQLIKKKFYLTYNFPDSLAIKKINQNERTLEVGYANQLYLPDYWEATDKSYIYSVIILDISLPRIKKIIANPNQIIFQSISNLGNYQKENWSVPYNTVHYYMDYEVKGINADVAGRCCFKLNKPFKGEYHYCVVQFSQKNDIAQVFTYFFFKELDTILIEKVLADNFQIVCFNKEAKIDSTIITFQ